MRKPYTLLVSYAAVLFLAPQIFAIFRLSGTYLLGEQLLHAHPWLAQTVTYAPVAALLFIFLKATLRPASHYGFRYDKQLLGTSAGIGALSAAVLYTMDAASGFFAASNIPADPTVLAAAGYLLSWGIVGPLVEEWFFRGMIQTSLIDAIEGEWKIHPAIVLTVALELLFHAAFGIDWVQLAYVAAFGLAASAVYMRTRSLLGPLLIHAIGNGGELLLFWILT